MPMRTAKHGGERAGARWRRRTVVAATALVALVAGGAVAQPTSASWTDRAYLHATVSTDFWRPWYGQLRLAGTQLCLDVPNRDDETGLNVQLYACNSTPAQIWTFLLSEATLRVYESVGIRAPGDDPTPLCAQQNQKNNNPVAITLQRCRNFTNADYWDVVQVDGGYWIRSRSRVNNAYQCLDVASGSQTQGTLVTTSPCTAANRARVWVPEYVASVSYA